MREHPGRIGNAMPQGGSCRSIPGTFKGRTLRAGDPELKLRVEGLNGYAAMMATMKEMGYESDGDEDQTDVPEAAKVSGTKGVPDVETGIAIAPAPTCSNYCADVNASTYVKGVDSSAGTGTHVDGPASAMSAGRRRTRLVVVAIVSIILGLVGAATSTIIFASREGGAGRRMLEPQRASELAQTPADWRTLADWCTTGVALMDTFRARSLSVSRRVP